MQKIILLSILFLTISVSPVLAQQENLTTQVITLNTDKTAYYEGDVITITGNVSKVITGDQIIIQVLFDLNIIGVDQLSVTESGDFTTTIVAKGAQWQNEGTVIIKAVYGQEFTETSIKFFKETGTNFISHKEVTIPGGGTFDVNYTLKGAVVKSIELNTENLALDILIDTDSNGALDIELLRDNIDSINENGFDEKFIVLIYTSDGESFIQTEFNEIETTVDSRSLYIPIKDGDSKIQIIGTKVIPEFRTIVTMIFVIAIISMIAISAKTKLNLLPKI